MKNVIIFALLLIATISWSQGENLLRANQLLEKKQYTEAISSYNEILDSGSFSGAIYYNLANAYYESGDLANAVLHYERAIKLNPNNSDYHNNLKVTRASLDPEISEIPPFFLSKWWVGLSCVMSSGQWAILQLILLILIVFFCYKLFLKKYDPSHKKKLIYSMGLTFFLSMIVVALAITKRNIETDISKGVIMDSQTNLHISPDEKSEIKTPLGPGTKVKLLDKIGDWSKVELRDREHGWVPTSSFEII